MKFEQLRLVILAGIVTGCSSIGPEYHEPQLNNPQRFSSTDGATVVSNENMPDTAWWRKFNDPQLNALIESALINNNNLQIALGNLLQSKASLQKVQRNWIPTVDIGGAGFTGQYFNPGFQNLNGNPVLNLPQNNPQSFDGYAFGAMPSYTLNIFRQIKQGEIAKLNLALQKQSVNSVRLAVISQVANSYFTLLGLHKQLKLQQAMLEEAQQLRRYTLAQYQNGSVSQLNLEGLDLLVATLGKDLPGIEDNIVQTENALQVLTNNNPGKIKLRNDFDAVSTSHIIPVNLPSKVLKSRPDVAIAQYQLQANNANIGAVLSKFFPTISLTGNVGQMSMQLSNLFNAGGDFWSATLGATMPLFNMGIYSEIDQAKGAYYSAYYNYIQIVRSAFAEVDNALSKHDSLNKEYTAQASACQSAGNLYTIGQHQYQAGAISLANTIGFKLNADYMAANLNQLKIKQMNSIVNLYQVLGGGYNAESNLTQVKKFNDSHDI